MALGAERSQVQVLSPRLVLTFCITHLSESAFTDFSSFKISFIRLIEIKRLFGFISNDEFTILVEDKLHVKLHF